jgi:hypothetical protein
MASLVYHKALENWARGNIDFDTDTFKVMLVTSSYTPNKSTHDYRDDVTNEATGTGYTAGGATATVTVTLDTVNDRLDIGLGGATWAASTISARGAVYYKSRGGGAGVDELVAYIDFGATISSTNGTFTLDPSTIRVNN